VRRCGQESAGVSRQLQRETVIGTQFGAGEVAYLSEETRLAAVRAPLMALVRRDLLRPDPEAMLPMGADDEAFRFRHQLIRDGAYAGMSKADRARLHERYAGLLEELPDEKLRPLDEVVGYHLEQALVLSATLGGEPPTPGTAARAARHLGAAGLRARERSDWAAAANLLARAAALMPASDSQRVALLPGLGDALVRLGRFDDAQAAINEAIEATANGADPAARVFALWVRGHLASLKGATQGEMKPDVEEALAIAEATGDPAQLAYAHGGLAGLALGGGRLADGLRELEIALDATQRSGDPNLEALARTSVAEVKSLGPWPAADIDRILADNLAWARDHSRRRMEAHMLRMQASEAATRGQMPEARRLMAKGAAIFEELGALVVIASSLAADRANLEYLAGDPLARERALRDGYEQLSAMGERGSLSTVAAYLADALIDLGRLDEAESMCAVAEEAGAEDDESTQVGVRLGRGRLAAARGSMDEALTSVAGAVALADEGVYYDLRATSRLVYAHLLLDAGRASDARASAEEVLGLVRPGRDVIIANRARDLMKRAAKSSRRPT
jgi:tetratricopeptide (TPR) repeat protein